MASEHINSILVLSATAVVALCTAFLDSAVIAFAASYPLRIQEAFQLGIGISTLISSIYRVVTKLAFNVDSVVLSSLVYFYSGAIAVLICLGAYIWLLRLPVSRRCLNLTRSAFTDASPLISHEINSLNQDGGVKVLRVVTKWGVFKKVWFNEVVVMLLFVSTLALWPPLVTEIKSYQFPDLNASEWWPLILLTLFSISDCSGRSVVKYRGPINHKNIWIPVLLRFLFIPLIVMCVNGYVFTHDAWSFLFVFGLGFTNGYVGTLTIVLVNECVEEDEIALAGTLTSFFLNTGLVIGASAGLAMKDLVGTTTAPTTTLNATTVIDNVNATTAIVSGSSNIFSR